VLFVNVPVSWYVQAVVVPFSMTLADPAPVMVAVVSEEFTAKV
jgi:hypothetical protein